MAGGWPASSRTVTSSSGRSPRAATLSRRRSATSAAPVRERSSRETAWRWRLRRWARTASVGCPWSGTESWSAFCLSETWPRTAMPDPRLPTSQPRRQITRKFSGRSCGPSEDRHRLSLRTGNACVTVTRLLPKAEDAELMRSYEASSMIASSPEAVWAVLADGAAWPSWDSGVDGVDGRIASGEKITVRAQAAPGRAFPVKVTDFEPPGRLRFSGGMPLGLFRGVRTYEVSPDGTGGVALRVREEYNGPLLGLIWRAMA